MRCNWVPKRLIVFVLTALLVMVMTGTFGVVYADGPSNGDEPVPVTPPGPDGSSAGDAFLLLDLLLGISGAVLL